VKFKRFLSVAGSALLLMAVAANGTPAGASKLQELEKKKEEIQSEKASIHTEMEEANQKINEIKSQQAEVTDDLQSLDQSIQATEAKIKQQEGKIAEKKSEIEKLKKEIAELEKRIEKRDRLLKERARTVQATGGTISYLEVLLGSKSFTDFIDRLSAVSTILEADKSIIEEQKRDNEALKKNKKKVENELAQVEKLKKELEAQKASLASQRAKKERLLAELEKKKVTLEGFYVDLKEKQQILAEQEVAIKKAMEAEKKRLEALKRQQQNRGNGGNVGSSPSQNGGSGFIWPANGTLTSGFGPRWGSFHYGIDIANGKGTPVYAAADGEVFSVVAACPDASKNRKCGGGYGNRVFITHVIDGQVYTTIYAHLNSVLVSNGQYVKQGQQIGTIGNTGDSYGYHLHFEVHPGGYNGHSSARNPLDFLP